MLRAHNGCLVYMTLYQQGHFVKEATLRSRLLTSNRLENIIIIKVLTEIQVKLQIENLGMVNQKF